LSAKTWYTRFIFGWVISGLDFSGPRLRSWSFHFCVSILLLASYPCIVYPHIGDFTNLAGFPPLKPNIIFCVYILDHNLSLSMDHQFKEDRWCQDWRIQVSLQRKSISGTYLIFITSLPADEQTSKHGGGGRYTAILEFKGEQIKKWEREKNEKEKERKRNKEEKIYVWGKKKRKNMSMCKNKNKVNSPVL
jgi:hypothetical protein